MEGEWLASRSSRVTLMKRRKINHKETSVRSKSYFSTIIVGMIKSRNIVATGRNDYEWRAQRHRAGSD